MTLRIGVIGCGRAASLHFPAIKGLRGTSLTAVADGSSEVLESVGNRYGIRGRYLDYRSLLSDPGVDAVAICTPPALHESIGLAALAAGKHVFMEKPLAL
jgi:predicted dehydrogenase